MLEIGRFVAVVSMLSRFREVVVPQLCKKSHRLKGEGFNSNLLCSSLDRSRISLHTESCGDRRKELGIACAKHNPLRVLVARIIGLLGLVR